MRRLARVVLGCAGLALATAHASAWELGYLRSYWDGVDGFDGLGGAFSIAASPDGAHLYVAGYYDHSLAVLGRQAVSGQLTFVEAEFDGVDGVDGLQGAYAVAISPDGEHVYVAGLLDGAVAVFDRDSTTGAVTVVEVERDGVGDVNGLGGASAVAVSPDGASVYVAGFFDSAVAVFARDAVTGELDFVEALFDGLDGVDGLAAATGLAVSPDGAHVYVVGEGDGGLAVFERDPGTGALTFVEAELDGVGGVNVLGGASAVAVSPDGAQVYVTAAYDSALVAFDRSAVTGELELAQEMANGSGFFGMSGPRAVTVSVDGSRVYVAAYGESTVVSFARAPADGALSFVEFRGNGWGVSGLTGARSVAASGDGRHVYVAGSTDGAVVAFAVTIFSDGFEWGGTTAWSMTVGD